MEEVGTIKEKVMENVSKMQHVSNLQKSINESLQYTLNNQSTIPKGETRSTNHEIFLMNEFYLDMMKRLRGLRVEEEESEEDDGGSVLSEVVNAIEKRRDDPDIKRQIDLILQLDEDIDKNMMTLKEEKLERQMVQQELCEFLENESADDDSSKYLCDLFKRDLPKKKSDDKVIPVEMKEEIPKNLSQDGDAERSESLEDHFIKRNIEAAKNSTNMASASLTDEEKGILEKLLSDIDSIQEDELPNTLTTKDKTDTTPFRLDSTEEAILGELETKIKEIWNKNWDENFDAIERNDREGKHWKIAQRLKSIEDDLQAIEKENEEYQKTEVDMRLLKPVFQVDEVDDENEMANRVLASYKNMLAEFEDELDDEKTAKYESVLEEFEGNKFEKKFKEVKDGDEAVYKELDVDDKDVLSGGSDVDDDCPWCSEEGTDDAEN